MKNIFGIHLHLKPLKPLKRFTKTIQIFFVVFQISKITNELDIPFAIYSFIVCIFPLHLVHSYFYTNNGGKSSIMRFVSS